MNPLEEPISLMIIFRFSFERGLIRKVSDDYFALNEKGILMNKLIREKNESR